MPRKPQKKPANAVEELDGLFTKIDPEVVLAGSLGAIAAYGGIVPPFTSLLLALGGNSSSSPISKAADSLKVVQESASPALLFYTNSEGILKAIVRAVSYVSGPATGPEGPSGAAANNTPADPEQKKKDIATYAIMASGAFEAMLMMEFAKNPEFQKTVYGMMREGVNLAGAVAGLAGGV